MNGLEDRRRESCFTRTMLLHTSLWLKWLLCVTVALNWLITFHILLIWHHLTIFCSPTTNMKQIIVLMKQDCLCHFSGPFTKCLWYYFPSPELHIQCGFIWKETKLLVSDKVDTYRLSLLWHYSFLVSL